MSQKKYPSVQKRFSEIELFIQFFLGIQKLLIVVLTYYFFRTIKTLKKPNRKFMQIIN